MLTGRFNNCKVASEKNAAANPPTISSNPERSRNQHETKERGRVRINLIKRDEKYSLVKLDRNSVKYETAMPEMMIISNVSMATSYYVMLLCSSP